MLESPPLFSGAREVCLHGGVRQTHFPSNNGAGHLSGSGDLSLSCPKFFLHDSPFVSVCPLPQCGASQHPLKLRDGYLVTLCPNNRTHLVNLWEHLVVLDQLKTYGVSTRFRPLNATLVHDLYRANPIVDACGFGFVPGPQRLRAGLVAGVSCL